METSSIRTSASAGGWGGIDDLFGPGTNPAILLGSGPLPTPELERFACYADLVGTIFSGDGEVLWQGRRVHGEPGPPGQTNVPPAGARDAAVRGLERVTDPGSARRLECAVPRTT